MDSGPSFAGDLCGAWLINARLNLYLLDALTEPQLTTVLAKGKSVGAQFSHIHNVRLMWLKASAEDLHSNQEKLADQPLTKDLLSRLLSESAKAIEELVIRGLAAGKVKNFKPHPAAFVSYLIAHEANHRGHVELALRQAGTPLPDKIAYGLWEWGVR